MKLLALILLLTAVAVNAVGSKKKITEEAVLTTDLSNLTESDDEPVEIEKKPASTSSPPPAIIAIEILDPEDNSTEARSNTKRTIESNLGYGYNGGIYKTQKKFMVYPYSQRDIPAPKRQEGQRSFSIQKAITYNLGTRIEPDFKQTQQNAAYYPSTLYSTVQQNGQVGSLSTQFPGNYHGQTVPVIILRVYSNQLTNPHAGIYPNLPQSHPQASYLNTVNLQELVLRYYKQQQQKLLYQAQQAQYQTQQPAVYQTPQPAVYQTQQPAVYQTQAPVYQAQSYQGQDYNGYQTETQGYNQQGYQYQQAQPATQGYTQYQPVYQTQYQTPLPISDASTLPTHENYPDDKHTRVIYHSPRGHIQGGVSYAMLNRNYNSLASSAKVPVNQYDYKDTGEKEQVVHIKPATHYNYDVTSQQSPTVYNYNTIKQTTAAQYYPETQYKQNTIYTDNTGQSYIYVLPSQIQSQQVQTANDYTQNQLYYQQGYQPVDEPQAEDGQQTEAPYNYHAHEATNKERNKKSSGSPVTFEDNNSNKKKRS